VSEFRTLASRHAYRGFSSVRIDTVVNSSDGRTFTREVVEHGDAVAIVALDAEGRVALLEQFRQPLGTTLREIPAGTLDRPDEDPIAAAHRELAEEIGFASNRLLPLGTLWNSAGWSDERTSLFLALDLRPAARPEGFVLEDEEAAMTLSWRPLDEVVSAALEGRLTDAKTVVGVLRAQHVLSLEDARAGADR
jgi:8-oxo-dGDP phosphatase